MSFGVLSFAVLSFAVLSFAVLSFAQELKTTFKTPVAFKRLHTELRRLNGGMGDLGIGAMGDNGGGASLRGVSRGTSFLERSSNRGMSALGGGSGGGCTGGSVQASDHVGILVTISN